jgi:hypothetical protein
MSQPTYTYDELRDVLQGRLNKLKVRARGTGRSLVSHAKAEARICELHDIADLLGVEVIG